MGLEQLDGLNSTPTADELELSLIGPGWGECILIHLGGGIWIIIDSCIDNSSLGRTPAALSYLNKIAVDSEQNVKLILCTHWHDDHIGGLSQLVDHCRQANFFLSSALRNQQFAGMVRAYQKGSMTVAGSGVTETDRIFASLRGSRRPAKLAIQDRLVFRLDSELSGHGLQCLVWSLSPSDTQVAKFLAGLSLPSAGETKGRCPALGPNHQTVVVWIEIGETKILLGGDLEETGSEETGWSIIVGSRQRPDGRAVIFKVPHHGSRNGHSDQVWNEMLVKEPFAILTPWNRGLKLPTPADVARLTGLTPNAYSSSRLRSGRARRRAPAVEKTLRELGVSVKFAEPRTGILRLRRRGSEPWKLERFGDACHLSEVYPQPGRLNK